MQPESKDPGPVNFIELPVIRQRSLEARSYQEEVAKLCFNENTLVVIPTGLGKTAIALLVAAHFLSVSDDVSVLILAPTRVLVHQHFDFFVKHLALQPGDVGVLTGEDSSEERESVWSKRVVCATPQVTLSEIEAKNCKLDRFSLIVFDEVHRAVGNHSYSTLASIYNEYRPNGRLMGMTASLPSDRSKIEEIVTKLKITKIEMRDETADSIRPYVFKTDTQWIELELSPSLKIIQSLVKSALHSRIKLMEDASLLKRANYSSISLKDLLRLRTKVDEIQSTQLRSALFSSIRLFHALNLIETQSLLTFKNFMDRLIERRRGYGMSELLNDPLVKEAYEKAQNALSSGTEHPKIAELKRQLESKKEGDRVIVFASYRDTVDQIYSELKKSGFRAGYLIGKSGEGGQNQKKQVGALQQLRDGVYDILVATQVGEEGLDVAECNLVIFYDNVPSAVRFVQRKGRTGRRSTGRICALITKGTRDETYYWLSRRRAGDAKKIATSIVSERHRKGPLDTFVQGGSVRENLPVIYADTREASILIEKLRYRGARVEVTQLDFGDFVLSSEVVVERKTLDDFVKSIFDGRLFEQLKNMNEKYSRPILVIEGERRRHVDGIGESAFYGALASALADFRVPIFFASSQDDAAEIMYHIARREQVDKKRETRIREGKKPMTLAQNQLYIVAGIPNVSNVLADRLLTKFGSIKNLFSATELDLLEVEGIGSISARKIHEVATSKYVSPSMNEIRSVDDRGSLENFVESGQTSTPEQEVQEPDPSNVGDQIAEKVEKSPLDRKNKSPDSELFLNISPPPSDD